MTAIGVVAVHVRSLLESQVKKCGTVGSLANILWGHHSWFPCEKTSEERVHKSKFSTTQNHYPDLDSDAPTVWHICACASDLTSRKTGGDLSGLGCFPIVRTDWPDHSHCNENFSLIKTVQPNQSNPKQYARRKWFFRKNSWKKLISFADLLVWPASSDKWRAPDPIVLFCLFR